MLLRLAVASITRRRFETGSIKGAGCDVAAFIQERALSTVYAIRVELGSSTRSVFQTVTSTLFPLEKTVPDGASSS